MLRPPRDDRSAVDGGLRFGIAAHFDEPKPFERPVSRSIMTLALVATPTHQIVASLRRAPCKARLPT
jgi:hypothetical protein